MSIAVSVNETATSVSTVTNTAVLDTALEDVIVDVTEAPTQVSVSLIPGLGYTPVNKAGDTMTGALFLKGPIYDVKAYGAVGNGVTDDTTAIQSAINAATVAGGIVFFPAATYLSSSLDVKSNVTLLGVGPASIILCKPPGGQTALLSIVSHTNVRVLDLTVDGNETNTAQNVLGAYLAVSTKVIIERVVFQNLTHFAVSDDASAADNAVIDCFFYRCGTKSIVGANVSTFGARQLIQGCTFQDWGGVTAGKGLQSTGVRSRILDNTFRVPGGGSVDKAINIASGGDGSVVQGNTIDLTGYAGTARVTGGIWVDTAPYVAIVGNTIRVPAQVDGSLEPIGLLHDPPKCIVANNSCYGGSDNGISLWGSECTCTGNYVEKAGFHGISVNGNNNTVNGNVVKNSGQRSTPFAGIYIYSPRTGNVVTGNRCFDDQGSPTQVYGVMEAGSANYNLVVGNGLRGNSSAATSLVGANTVNANNVT